ncbi:MAG: NUDIX domain-containing protein [Saprospiraceae bacterium]|nr:NUDIX domain-containing protein [Saprospiraceae bacterium]
MYKIYINENCLIIAEKTEVDSLDNDVKVIPFMAGKKGLLNYVDKLEKSPAKITIALVTTADAELFADFRSLYKFIEAAGGLCLRNNAEMLFIERLGVWDLPKGKVDRGEDIESAAIREVQEETGLETSIVSKVGNTWHTYYDRKERRILKRTNWFEMMLSGSEIVRIQREENITDFRWIHPQQFLEGNFPTYQSIREIVKKYVKTA